MGTSNSPLDSNLGVTFARCSRDRTALPNLGEHRWTTYPRASSSTRLVVSFITRTLWFLLASNTLRFGPTRGPRSRSGWTTSTTLFGKDNLLHGRGVGVVDLSDLQTAPSLVREGGGLGKFGVLALWPSPESNNSQFGKALQRGRR